MEDHGLSTEELERVLKFEGYGNKSAPYWFLGMEEGGGSIEQLRVRARKFESVEDLDTAHKKLDLDIAGHVPVWRLMSKLIMAMQRTSGWQETATARDYQANKLGRVEGDTFLTELMPLPSPSSAVWPYPLIFPSRKEYNESVRPGRISWLRSEILANQPCFVICYGKGNWGFYEEIFCGRKFRFELNGQIRAGQSGHSTILFLPFFSYYFVTTELITQIADLYGRKHHEGCGTSNPQP